jgi:hypothetical protein
MHASLSSPFWATCLACLSLLDFTIVIILFDLLYVNHEAPDMKLTSSRDGKIVPLKAFMVSCWGTRDMLA